MKNTTKLLTAGIIASSILALGVANVSANEMTKENFKAPEFEKDLGTIKVEENINLEVNAKDFDGTEFTKDLGPIQVETQKELTFDEFKADLVKIENELGKSPYLEAIKAAKTEDELEIVVEKMFNADEK